MDKKTITKLGGIFVAGVISLAAVSCSKKEPEFFTIKNKSNLEVTFCDRGASIYSIYYEGLCVTYQPEDHDDFLTTNKYSGKIVGRTSGRVDGGKMNIDGKDYQFSINEHDANTLHGGKDGISTKDFKHEIKTNNDNQQVIFTYTSPDGESGYPGTVDFVITYTIPNDSDSISIDMLGTPRTNDKTPICLTGHTYWRLGGVDGIKNHELKISADNIANSRRKDQIIEPGLVPITGDGISDFQKSFDFNAFKEIGQDIDVVAANDPVALGYDHGWIFNSQNSNDELKNKVELQNKSANIHLTVSTDINMVFIYANCHPVDTSKMLVYGDDEQYGGVAIEPMVYLNNKSDGSGYNDLLCTKDNPFHKHIEYSLDHNIK